MQYLWQLVIKEKKVNIIIIRLGLELKHELRKIPLYELENERSNIDYIEEFRFREYVFYYETYCSYCRETALRKAYQKYINLKSKN